MRRIILIHDEYEVSIASAVDGFIMSKLGLNVFDVKNPSIRALHVSWTAFFITFLVWFNHVLMTAAIGEAFDLIPNSISKETNVFLCGLRLFALCDCVCMLGAFTNWLRYSSVMVPASLPRHVLSF